MQTQTLSGIWCSWKTGFHCGIVRMQSLYADMATVFRLCNAVRGGDVSMILDECGRDWLCVVVCMFLYLLGLAWTLSRKIFQWKQQMGNCTEITRAAEQIGQSRV